MSKEKERAYFELQESNNLYVLLITIIFFLVSILNSLSNSVKILAIWILSLVLVFFGISIIVRYVNKVTYFHDYLIDGRKKSWKYEKIFSSFTFYSVLVSGIIVSLLGIFFILLLSKIIPISILS